MNPTVTILDVEATGAQRNKGHPFDHRNRLTHIGIYVPNIPDLFTPAIEYRLGSPYGDSLQMVQRNLDATTLLVGVNIKYDLHWCTRYGLKLPEKCRIFDCQLAEFLLSSQKTRYPSMAGIEQRLFGKVSKKSTLTDYYDLGLDTDDVPEDELIDYLAQDLVGTYKIYKRLKKELIEQNKWTLFQLQCADLLTLQECEFNGARYNYELSAELSRECTARERRITESLSEYIRDVPTELGFNWQSNDHFSALLFGGTVPFNVKVLNGTFKTGPNAGNAKYRNEIRTHIFPRLVPPRKGTELKKEGFYSTSEGVLADLHAKGKAKKIIDAVLELSKLQKIRGTYYDGIPKIAAKKGWEDGYIHGQLNQCVAITGRLSSSEPNLQNNSPEVKKCFESRYAD